ncbi:hypothetical protein DSS3PM1_00039 [Bacteriophage DSS3_PM1]|nr:hypothetical protein DSS3PM1_00039 [Bacteriophage DSS3_PM1]
MKGNLVAAMGGGGFFMMINGKVHFVDPLRGRFGPTRLPYKNLHEVIACKKGCGIKKPIYDTSPYYHFLNHILQSREEN